MGAGAITFRCSPRTGWRRERFLRFYHVALVVGVPPSLCWSMEPRPRPDALFVPLAAAPGGEEACFFFCLFLFSVHGARWWCPGRRRRCSSFRSRRDMVTAFHGTRSTAIYYPRRDRLSAVLLPGRSVGGPLFVCWKGGMGGEAVLVARLFGGACRW